MLNAIEEAIFGDMLVREHVQRPSQNLSFATVKVGAREISQSVNAGDTCDHLLHRVQTQVAGSFEFAITSWSEYDRSPT